MPRFIVNRALRVTIPYDGDLTTMLRTRNPAFRQPVFQAPAQGVTQYQDIEGATTKAPPGVMTVQGAVNKSSLLILICAGFALIGWKLAMPIDSAGVQITPKVPPMVLLFGGLITGAIFGFATFLKPAWARVTAPLYAVSEGIFLGAISAWVALALGQRGEGGELLPYTGVVINAAMLTMGVLASMLIAYKTRLIRATEKFKTGVMAATGAIMLVYFVNIMLSLFGASIPFLHSAGPIGIGISLFVIVIAAMNLVLDFDYIENAARNHAPQVYEWVAGAALLATLVWLYIEILRLLAILASRRD